MTKKHTTLTTETSTLTPGFEGIEANDSARSARADRRAAKARDALKRSRKIALKTARDPREKTMPEPTIYVGYEHPNQAMYRAETQRAERIAFGLVSEENFEAAAEAWHMEDSGTCEEIILALMALRPELEAGDIVALGAGAYEAGLWLIDLVDGQLVRYPVVFRRRDAVRLDSRVEPIEPWTLTANDVLLDGHTAFRNAVVIGESTPIDARFLASGLFVRVGWARPTEMDKIHEATKSEIRFPDESDLEGCASLRTRYSSVDRAWDDSGFLRTVERIWLERVAQQSAAELVSFFLVSSRFLLETSPQLLMNKTWEIEGRKTMKAKLFHTSVFHGGYRGSSEPDQREVSLCALGVHVTYKIETLFADGVLLSADMGQIECVPCDGSCRKRTDCRHNLGTWTGHESDQAAWRAHVEHVQKDGKFRAEPMSREVAKVIHDDGDSGSNEYCHGAYHVSMGCSEFGMPWDLERVEACDCAQRASVTVPDVVAREVKKFLAQRKACPVPASAG